MDLISVPIELTNNNIRRITFQVLADIYKNNTYSLDITNYIVSIDNIITDLEFRQKGTVLGKPSVNTASITLDNTNGLFSPNNINNIEKDYIGGQFRCNTPIKILAGFIDSNNQLKQRILFQGIITAFKNKISRDSKQVVLTLKDYAILLQHMKVPNHDFKNGQFYEAIIFDVTINEAIDYLIDYALGINFPRTLHKLTERLPIVEFVVENSIWQTLQLLAQSVEGRIFFEAGEFKFYSPLSSDWNQPLESQYIFNADNIQDFIEEIDFDNIINKWEITSNPKTMQIRQVLCGTPSSNTISMVDEYWSGDTKNALDVDNKTITLKSQDQTTLEWIDSLNVPLVYTQTYNDLIQLIPNPTQDQINTMNNQSLIKVWDRINNIQLTINKIDTKHGKIELLNPINPTNYNLQIVYQYYQDQIVHGKYREYVYDLEKIGTNIELPIIIANNIAQNVEYSTTSYVDTLYLSDWTIFEGNKRVKFKLTNNVPIAGELNELDTVYITKFEIWGNALECTTPLVFKAIDGDTINQFENPYEINNDYISNIVWGKKICDYYLYRYKSNLTFLDVNTKGIPQIDLLDRVTINETVSGNNFDYIVIGIKHSIKKDGWKTELQLESLIPPWVYDESRVNTLYYKYGQSYLSLYSETTPSNPNAFSIIEQTFVQKSGEVVTRVFVSFVPPLYAYYSHTLIQISDDNGLTWTDCGTSNDGKFYIYNVEVEKYYKIRAITVSLNGQKSNAVESGITILGKNMPPSNVPNFTLTQSGSFIKVTVEEPDDPDIDHYELRLGPSWENSVLIKNMFLPNDTIPATQEGTQTFWIKAVDRSGLKSINPTKNVIVISGLPPKNIVAERTENITTWQTTGMFYDYASNCWMIDSQAKVGDFVYFADIFASDGGASLRIDAEAILPPLDVGPSVIPEGYFYYSPYDGQIKLYTTHDGVNPATLDDYVDFWDLFAETPVYLQPPSKFETTATVDIDWIQSSNNYISIYYRTSFDGVSYNNWQYMENHQFFGRYIQIKLVPGSLDGKTNVRICGCRLAVDVPDVTEKIPVIMVSATGVTRVNLINRYWATPFLKIYSQDNYGKSCTYEIVDGTAKQDVDRSWYFEIRLWDGVTQIAGKIYGEVEGY